MASDDEILGGVIGASDHGDDTSTVSMWLARRNGKEIVIRKKAELGLDFTELAQRAAWTPQVRVSAFTADEPSLSSPWPYSRTAAGGELVYRPGVPGKSVRRVVIQLQGLAATQSVTANVGVRLTIDEQRHDRRIQLDVGPKPLRITAFRARPSIVVTGSPVTFEVACEEAAAWTIEEIKGTTATAIAASPSVAPSAPMNTAGVATFRLTAKSQSGAEQTANALVKVVDASGWISGGAWWAPQQVATLCVSPEGDAIYALVRSKDDASVWWSADGFGRWDKLADVPVSIAMVTTAPGACVNVRNQTKVERRLVFAGGSKVDPRDTSNRVWSLDVTTRKWSDDDWPPDQREWKPRMGHACVVAPDSDGVSRLWLIGGADANGNALDDAYVSVDGARWESRTAPGWNRPNREDPAVGPGRCMFGATVVGSEIWIGGGFEEPDGRAVNDIWRWNTKQKAAEQLKRGDGALRVTTDGTWYLSAFALVALGKQTYVAAVERREGKYQAIFSPLRTDRGGWAMTVGRSQPPWLPEDGEGELEHARIEAVAFNGCIWLVVQRFAGDHEIAASGLHYYLPPQPGSTR